MKKEEITYFQLILKITERCNLACSYCYFFFGGDESYKVHPPVMSEEVINDLSGFLDRMVRDLPSLKHISIILHGGEPLLMKRERFDYLCSAIQNAVGNRCELTFGMQTNGILINDEWISLFEKHKIGVGVSIDGPKEVNDVNRIDHRGRGTYDRIVAGWRKLVAAAEAGRISHPGLLCVVDPKQDGAQVFEALAKDLHFQYTDFLLLDVNHETSSPETVAASTEYYLRLFKAWRTYGDRKVRIRFFSELIACFQSDALMRQYHHQRWDLRQHIVVSSNGDIGTEDVVRTLHPRFAHINLNIRDATVQQIVDSSVWQEMTAARNIRPEPCQSCGWWNICHGGYLPTRYSAADGLKRETVYCSLLKTVYPEVVAQLVRSGIPFEDISRRLGDLNG
jgi:uncharacterized protein